MRNFLIKTLALILILSNVFITLNIKDTFAFPPLYAEGIYIMDGVTGKVLFEQNSDIQYEPASTTKVMTAILAIENCELNEKITIGEYPPLVDGSAIGIEQGEVYTMEELLLGLLLESGNDMAEAIADHISGSNAAFGELMTKKAKEIGATKTVFKNPSGLSEEGHVTTAHDLALIMQYALGLEDFVRISRTPYYQYKDQPFYDGSEKWATNRNNCLGEDSLYYYPNLYSGKTGYTPEANHTYTSAAKKDDQVLVLAMLNAVDKAAFYTSVGELFDWGFENFKTEKIISKGDTLEEYTLNSHTTIPLLATKDVYYTFNINEGTTLNKSIHYANKDLSTSTIKKGDIILDGSLLINGTKYMDIELASGIDREYTTEVKVQQTVEDITSNKFFTPLAVVGIIILVAAILLIGRIIYVKKRREKLRRQRRKRQLYMNIRKNNKRHNF